MAKTVYRLVYSLALSRIISLILIWRKSQQWKRNWLRYIKITKTLSNFQRDVYSMIEITFNNDLFGDLNESYDKLENVIINAKNNNFQPKYNQRPYTIQQVRNTKIHLIYWWYQCHCPGIPYRRIFGCFNQVSVRPITENLWWIQIIQDKPM